MIIVCLWKGSLVVKTKHRFKIALDIIMLLLVITFFDKSLISLAYHEIAGLILIGLFLVHIIINIKTISVLCKRFEIIPTEIKIGMIVDILLIACFVWIAVSGILISRTILTSISSDQLIFKVGHMFAGGVSIILLGIHIGLHLGYRKFPVIVSVLLTFVVLCGGIYGVIHSKQINWLSIPFSTSVSSENPKKMEAVHGNIEKDQGAKPQENGSLPSDRIRQDKKGETNDANFMLETNISQKIADTCMYLSMILSWSVITYWIVRAKKTMVRKKKVAENT